MPMRNASSSLSMSFVGLALVAACSSGSSGSSADAGPAGTAPTRVDGGIPCGLLGGGCAPPEACCMADPRAPVCESQSECAGSSLGCSTSAQCPNRQVCCFAYGAGDAGAAGARPYSAQCAEVCPSGDSTHYQLCAATAECLGGGETCVPGPFALYCMAGAGASPFPDLTAMDGGSE
jgi:hypothetical protein